MPRRFTASVRRRHALIKRRQKQVMKRRRKQFALPHGEDRSYDNWNSDLSAGAAADDADEKTE